MSNTYQESGGDSRASSYDRFEDAYMEDLTPKAANKRTFSDRQKFSDDTQQYGQSSDLYEDAEEEAHSGKRPRTSDWPLSNNITTSPSNTSHSQIGQRNRSTPLSLPAHRTNSSSLRPSRFVEGSMNDRVSAKPPTPFLGDDEEMRDLYEHDDQIRNRKMAQPRKPSQRVDSARYSTAGFSEMSRQSSVFRFGKSLAASFNPINWFGRKQPEPEFVETTRQKMLRERKEKAEKIYEELKQTGRFRDSAVPPTFDVREENLKQDSGIAIPDTGNEMTREEKRMGRIFLETPRYDKRGTTPGSMVSESVGGSGRKSLFGHIKKPSLSNIRKGFANESGSVPPEGGNPQARRIPSRKDLQKTQKLVKRVSDLEGKLEAARKQLAGSMGGPVPDHPDATQMESFAPMQPPPRPRFVPGQLSTLFSESNLAGYVPSDGEGDISDGENVSEIGRAVTADQPVDTAIHVSYGTHELLGDTQASRLVTDKSLPEIPRIPDTRPSDHVMQSIETMQSVEVEMEEPEEVVKTQFTRPTRRQKVQDLEKNPNVSSSHYTQPTASYKDDADEEDDDEDEDELPVEDKSELDLEPVKKAPVRQPPPLPKPTVTAPPKPSTAIKKRKSRSSFERVANDGGRYKPSKLSSASSSPPVKKTRTPKKTPTKIPTARKLQKPTSQQANGTTSPLRKKQDTNLERARKSPSPVFIKKTTSTVSRTNSKLAKRRIHLSPSPPTSQLSYQKPSLRRNSAAPQGDYYSAAPGEGRDVPAMPRVPDTVRLPSGEVISTAGKLTKVRSAPVGGKSKGGVEANGEGKENALATHDSFSWERDTF